MILMVEAVVQPSNKLDVGCQRKMTAMRIWSLVYDCCLLWHHRLILVTYLFQWSPCLLPQKLTSNIKNKQHDLLNLSFLWSPLPINKVSVCSWVPAPSGNWGILFWELSSSVTININTEASRPVHTSTHTPTHTPTHTHIHKSHDQLFHRSPCRWTDINQRRKVASNVASGSLVVNHAIRTL